MLHANTPPPAPVRSGPVGRTSAGSRNLGLRVGGIRLRLTQFGAKSVLFLVALVVAFYVSPYTNLFFLLLTFLGSLLGMNVWWTWSNLRGIEARIPDPGPVAAGDPIPVEVRMRHPGRGPVRLQITARVRLPKDVITAKEESDEPWWARPIVPLGHVPRNRTAAVVRRLTAADGEVRATGALPCCRRGLHALDRVVVSTTFPLGLVRATTEIEGPARLVVFPRPARAQDGRRSGASDAADEDWLTAVDRRDSAERTPAGLRPWREGDEVRDVHWRASARRQDLVVRESEAERTRCLEVVFDRRGSVEGFEDALSLLTALAQRQHQRKQALTVHSQGLSATFGEDGGRPVRDLLVWLAGCDLLPAEAGGPTGSASPDALRLPRPEGHRAAHTPQDAVADAPWWRELWTRLRPAARAPATDTRGEAGA